LEEFYEDLVVIFDNEVSPTLMYTPISTRWKGEKWKHVHLNVVMYHYKFYFCES